MSKASQTLSIFALLIAIIVIVNELPWLEKSKLAIVILGLAVAVGLNAIAIIVRCKND